MRKFWDCGWLKPATPPPTPTVCIECERYQRQGRFAPRCGMPQPRRFSYVTGEWIKGRMPFCEIKNKGNCADFVRLEVKNV